METIDDILIECVKLNSSDLHMVANSNPVIRVNGALEKLNEFPVLSSEKLKELLYSIIDDKKKKIFESTLELDFSYSISGTARFRCNYYLQRGSMAAAFRVVNAKIKNIEELGLPEKVKEFAEYARGLVLVCGPTGSGKSTTLASIIDIINENRTENIITVEDPIEYLHKHKNCLISQRELDFDTLSFESALKHSLREDPDIIMVGEMRDLETISSALTAAETGHLVFSTLHTQDAPQTIDRIIDIFPTHRQQQIRVQLAGTLKAVLVQQLLPSINGDERFVAVELMIVNQAIRNMIRETKSHQIYSAIQSGGREGMIMMDMSLAKLYKERKISKETALDKCHNKEEFNRFINSPSY